MKMKKLLALLLALTFVFSVVSIPATAEADGVETKVAYFSIDSAVTADVIDSAESWLGENTITIDGKLLKDMTFAELSAAEIAAGKLSDYDVLVIPGGDVNELAKALGSAASAKIEEYVANGGGYVGIEGAATLAAMGYSDETKALELINLKVDAENLNHATGQLMTKLVYHDPADKNYEYNHTIITNDMEVKHLKSPYFITYAENVPALTSGGSSDANMGAVVNVIAHYADATNNLELEKRDPGNHVSMKNQPAVATASYGKGTVVISVLGVHREEQPVAMDYLTGQMILHAAGVEEINVNPVSKDRAELDVMGEWLWGSEIYDRGVNGAEIVMQRCEDVGVTEVYFLAKGTGGRVNYFSDVALAQAYQNRDVLQELLTAAHKRGIKVHTWMTSAFDDTYYGYYGTTEGLCHYVRGRDQGIINITSENYINYMKEVVTELATKYDIDGIHFDYIRYNHITYGWGEEDIARMKEYGIDVDRLKSIIDKTFYNADADQYTIFKMHADGDSDVVKFAQMRCDNVMNFAKELTGAAKAVNPDLVVTAALMPEGSFDGNYNVSGANSSSFALLHYGQDYNDAAAFYDYLCPMLYSRTFNWSAQCLLALVANATKCGNKIVAGLELYNSVDRADLIAGVSPTTTYQINAEIEGLRKLSEINESVIGVAYFRTGLYTFANSTVDEANKTIAVQIYDSHTNVDVQEIFVEVAQDIKITKVLGAVNFTEGTNFIISDDGQFVSIQGPEVLMPNNDKATFYLEYEGTYNRTTGIGIVRTDMVPSVETPMASETRCVNIEELGTVTVPSDITVLPEATPTPVPTPTPEPTPYVPEFAFQAVLDTAAEAYEYYETNGEMPETVTISGTESIIGHSSFFRMMCQMLGNIDAGDTTSAIPNKECFDCNNPTADSFEGDTINKVGYLYNASRQLSYIDSNSMVPANYTSYPGVSGTNYMGQIGYARSLVYFARVLSEYKATGTLPEEVSVEWIKEGVTPTEPPIEGKDVALETVVDALDGVYAAYEATGKLPEVITVDDMSANMASYFRLACQAIVNLDKGDTSSALVYIATNEPDGTANDTFDSEEMVKAAYVDAATRQLNYTNNNNVPAKVCAFPSTISPDYEGQFTYHNAVVVFARVLAYYKANGELPEVVSADDSGTVVTAPPAATATPVVTAPVATATPVAPTATPVVTETPEETEIPEITPPVEPTPGVEPGPTGSNVSMSAIIIGLTIMAAAVAVFVTATKEKKSF